MKEYGLSPFHRPGLIVVLGALLLGVVAFTNPLTALTARLLARGYTPASSVQSAATTTPLIRIAPGQNRGVAPDWSVRGWAGWEHRREFAFNGRSYLFIPNDGERTSERGIRVFRKTLE